METIEYEDDLFLKLMEDSGVKALPKKQNKYSVPSPNTSKAQNNVVSAQESSAVILKRKFSGSALIKKSVKKVEKKPKTRKIEPDISVDLHGKTKKNALKKVSVLLENSKRDKRKTVLIITGKGLNSEKGGVLRRAIWRWLDYYQEKNNIKFNWAPPYLGGKGAILVSFP